MLGVVSTYSYRPAQPTDRERVEAMLARSFAAQLTDAYPPELVVATAPAFTRVNPTLFACGTWFVGVTPTGEVAGCGGWTREHPGSGEIVDGLGHVRHFCTDVDHLRRGVGREIAQLSFASARAAGIERLDCAATLSAAGFYRSLGLRTVERVIVPVPVLARPGKLVDFPTLLMRVELT